jgi:hypothetical protein
MKKVLLVSLVFLLVIFNWSLNPSMKQAQSAITKVYLVSPADSSKVMKSDTVFQWGVDKSSREKVKGFHIIVARDAGLIDPVWQDSMIAAETRKIRYGGDPFVEWQTYFWSVRVRVDSISRIDTIVTPSCPQPPCTTWRRDLWYNFVSPGVFFYSTATLIEVPDTLATIQEAIRWSGNGDTILVKPGTYYENLRFNKNSVVLASYFIRDTTNTDSIDSTIIDGEKLTRKAENGSVIYITSNVDSTSKVIGFTIRNGKGSKAIVGVEEKINGGGIFCAKGSTPTIAYNVITQNHVPDDGGGIFCYSAAPNIFNNLITNNSAGGSGGAIQCYYSVETKPSTSPGASGGEANKKEGIESMAEPSIFLPQTPGKTSPSSESNSEIKEDDWRNFLYPRDATEVFSAPSSDPLAKSAQNTPPVAVLTYYPVKDKYYLGDTITFDGSGSHDDDGDTTIIFYQYRGERWTRCENPDDWKSNNIKTCMVSPFESCTLVVGEVGSSPLGEGGQYRVWLTVTDDSGGTSAPSDTVHLNIQRPPRAYAGADFGIAPGDTAWLNASGSCDINPDDTTLTYLWTQIEGPIISIDTTTTPPETTFLWVTLSDSQAIRPYFETKDSSIYLGEYLFQLKVSDSDSFGLDTIKVSCSNPPVARCLYDSLAGLSADDLIPLDASLSSDRDSTFGDSVKYFIWKGISHTTCKGPTVLTITADSTKKVQNISATRGGGVYKFSLYVRDTYGVKSINADTLLVSVQLRPKANAGPDTIVRPKQKAELHGGACEVNWDQVLTYEWKQDTSGGVTPLTLYDPSGKPNPKSQNIWFIPPKAGVYPFELMVCDTFAYGCSQDPDIVHAIVNELPKIDDYSPDPRDTTFPEGDTIALRVWAHDDTADVRVFGDSLTYTWTIFDWPDYPRNTYRPAVMDTAKRTVRFVPIKRGDYRFKVVIHDTLSRKQYPSVLKGYNIDTVKVTIDTTYAYPFIMGNLISSNTAGLKGGGIDCIRSSPEINNNVFYKNKSGSSGGAVCLRFSSTPSIKNNIFFGNISADSTGGGIADLKAELSPAAVIGFRVKTEITYNDFWSNGGGNFYAPPADTFGNIYEYPRLGDPEYGDFRLECSSPCRGAGENSSDIGSLKHFQPCLNIDTLRMVSLSLFQNPVATSVADFVVNTDVPLKAPPLGYVTVGDNSPTPVDFTYISSTTYRGKFIFTSSGTARISIFASSVLEKDTSITRDFAVQLIGAGKIGKLVSHDNRLGLLFPQGTAKGDIYATCIPVSDDPQYNFEDEGKVTLGVAYHLGPASDFEKKLIVSFSLDDYDLTEKDRTLFSIYKYENNGWEKQASFLDENSVCAQVKKLGVYRLVYDAKQEHITGIPKTYQLFQNFPNPFNPQTVIKYDLPNPDHVKITVYNILGRKVKTLVDEQQEAGYKSVNWDGKDDQGIGVASGIYFYKIETSGFEKTRKMVLLK